MSAHVRIHYPTRDGYIYLSPCAWCSKQSIKCVPLAKGKTCLACRDRKCACLRIGPIPDVIADPDCSPTSPPRHILDCVLLPRISDFLEEEARARSEFLARQKILAQTRPMVIRAILAAASLLDIRPDLMPALGDPLDGLIHIKDSTPTKMDLYAGNIWNMYDMCVVHGLDGELAESIKEAHFTHKHWSLRNSSLMRAGLKYRSLYKQ